jgi:hypothetical protein
MNKLTLALLAAATALAIAPAAMATTVEYSTVGTFSNNSNTITDGTLTATFTDITDFTTVANPTSNVSAGTLSYTDSSNNPTTVSDASFNLEIIQILPGSGSGTLDGTITGSFSGDSSTGSLSFASTTLDLDGIIYTLEPTNTISQAGQDTTLQLVVTATPEPSSLLLLGTGLLGLAFVAFRKAKSSGLVLNM